MGQCEQEVRRHADPELLSLHRLHRLCMEGAPQDKGAEAIPHRKVQTQEQPRRKTAKVKAARKPCFAGNYKH